MIIDFEPQVSSNREGQALSDNAILARFYNNIAVEHFVNGNHMLAYAHFKAAILADPGFPPSYSNLALLYQRAALLADTEQLLRLAVRLSDANVIPLTALHQLMRKRPSSTVIAPA
jgi:Tfp pilus assembly protein PilF